MSPFLILCGLLFFLLGGLALALTWRGVVALVEGVSASQRPGATTHAFLLIAPVVLLLAFVTVLLGPWESEVCRSLQDACLERVTHWSLPTWVGLWLGLACVLVGGRAIKPYLARKHRPLPLLVLPVDLIAKWETAKMEVERLFGVDLPPMRFVEAPRHACYIRGLFRTQLIMADSVLRDLDPDELVGAVAHELAHLRRGDLWWGTCVFLCYCVLFFVPVSHRSYHGYLAARERAADDWAIAHTNRPLALASALGKVRRLAEAGVPVAPGGQILAGRLQRLLSGPPRRASRTRTPALGFSLMLAAIALPFLLPMLADLHHTLEPLGRGVLTALGIVS